MPAVKSIVLEPVEWDYDGTVWVLRHDNGTAPKWIAPTVDVNALADDSVQVVQALGDILDPGQVDALAAAVGDNSWPAADRYKALVAWHSYMTGRHDHVNQQMRAAAQMRLLVEKLGAKTAELIEEEAVTAVAAGGDDPQLPLEGS